MARSRLSSLDASFLRVETPSAHMHVAWKGRFAPRPDGRPVTLGALRRSVAARLCHAPRFRQRLAFPAGGFSEPVLVDDEQFAIEHHVVALGDPLKTVSAERFAALADGVLSERLDRQRALWRIHLVPRLWDGSIGLVMKVHHAMVDGKSAVELALLLLDVDPGAGDDALAAAEAAAPGAAIVAPGEEWLPQAAPGGGRLALQALAEAGGDSLRLGGRLARTMSRPASGVRLAGTLRRAALSVGEDLVRPAPSSYMNVPIGPRRTLVHHTQPLPPMLEVKRARGVTLNDVALAAVAGAARSLALAAGRTPRPLKVMVPVSTRAAEEAADLGNRIAFVFVELPVHLPRPAARLDAIREATLAFKAGGRAQGGETVLGALGALPAPLRDAAARLAASPRMYNLTISNVPGPRFPVHLLGSELIEAFPVIPITDGHALSIGIFSYRDVLCFGGYADPEAFPQAPDIPAALAAAVDDLHAALVQRSPSGRSSSSRGEHRPLSAERA